MKITASVKVKKTAYGLTYMVSIFMDGRLTNKVRRISRGYKKALCCSIVDPGERNWSHTSSYPHRLVRSSKRCPPGENWVVVDLETDEVITYSLG